MFIIYLISVVAFSILNIILADVCVNVIKGNNYNLFTVAVVIIPLSCLPIIRLILFIGAIKFIRKSQKEEE